MIHVSTSLLVLTSALLAASCDPAAGAQAGPPSGSGRASTLDSLLVLRRSIRCYTDSALAREEILRLLWAGGGLLPDGRRTVPSAGALYPLRLLLVAGDVSGVAPGIYRYAAEDSSLVPLRGGDLRRDLAASCLWQPWVLDAPASIVIAAEPSVTTDHYGDRGLRYVYIEAGHSSQNIYLECAALGLGTVAVGAFADSAVASVLGLGDGEIPVYVMPVGRAE